MWQSNHVTTMHGNTSTRRHWYVSQMNASSSIHTEPGFVGISSSLKRTTLQRDRYRLEVVVSLRLDVRLGRRECFAQFDAFFELPTENHLIASATRSRVSGGELATVSLSPSLFSCWWFKQQADFTVGIDQNGRGHDGWLWMEIRGLFPQTRPRC
jgi:hypothetical protein